MLVDDFSVFFMIFHVSHAMIRVGTITDGYTLRVPNCIGTITGGYTLRVPVTDGRSEPRHSQ
jgi:hypothetical protein